MIEAVFRILFSYDCIGEELLPNRGGGIVAANHPSYLDPILLSLQVRRPIRFMAWDALFRVPLLGSLIRAFGAFPVDTTRGRGRSAYETARDLVLDGEIVGLFPEGRRSQSGWMAPTLREGAARLALETGAPLFPATIVGAFRAWPHFRALPRPARIKVRFHEPIDPRPYRDLPESEAVAALLAELVRRVDRTLMPGVKADRRMDALYRGSAPWPLFHEYAPAFALAILGFWKTRSFVTVAPAYVYLAYLLADTLVIPQRRIVKWFRRGLTPFLLMVWGSALLVPLGLPAVPAASALLALVAAALFPYLYTRAVVSLAVLSGFSVASLLAFAALYLAPSGLGPHVLFPVYLAAFALDARSVFWRWSVPLLLAWAVLVPVALGGGIELLLHALFGLVAWFVGRLLGGPSTSRADPGPPPSNLSSLDLR
jgi:1-acyl-sn-glycerol-3-phosphate acyltransferase